jgi:hypothetical protein
MPRPRKRLAGAAGPGEVPLGCKKASPEERFSGDCSILFVLKLGIVVHMRNPSTREVEAGLGILSQKKKKVPLLFA